MRVIVEVRSQEAVEAVSKKSGKPYRTQSAGVLLAGQDFPVGVRMFVENAYPVGRYETTAELLNVNGDLKLEVNFRNLKPVQLPSGQKPS